MKKTLRSSLLILLSPTVLFAADGAGTTSSPFLKIPLSGRATAMAGAYSALATDVASLDYNPAGLAGIRRTDLQANYLDYLEDTTLQSALVGFPISLGQSQKVQPLEDAEFGPNQLSVGFEYRAFRAKDIGRSNIGVKQDEFDVKDQLLALGFAYPVTPRMSVGVSGKMISNKIQDKSVSNYAFDAGAVAKLSSRWSVGAAVQNAGTSKALDKESDPLPLALRAGAAYQYFDWLFSADVSGARDGVIRKSAGVEWSVNRLLFLRGGTFHDTALEFTGGVGIQFRGPQKMSYVDQPKRKKASNDPVPSAMSQQIVAHSVEKLSAQYLKTAATNDKPTITVLPIDSREKAAVNVSKMLEKDFASNPNFRYLKGSSNGEIPDSDLMVTGSLEHKDEKLAINTRILARADGDVLATDYAEIAVEDFHERNTLGSARESGEAEPTTMPANSHILIGLDYGFSTSQDLGLTHNVTLRILY